VVAKAAFVFKNPSENGVSFLEYISSGLYINIVIIVIIVTLLIEV
jgi:hypothetical protein